VSDQAWLDAIGAAYLVAAALLAWGLAGQRRTATARRGNLIVAAGALVAVIATFADREIVDVAWIVAGTVSGAILGAYLASRAGTGAMPRAIVLLLATGGAASLLLAIGELDRGGEERVSGEAAVPLAIAVVAGAVALAGALVVVRRLRSTGRGAGPPPGHRGLAVAGGTVALVLGALLVWSTQDEGFDGASVLALACLLAGVGLALGGLMAFSAEDRVLPALVALLTGVAGLALAADGVALENTAMIVAGGIVAAAGPTLARIMASAVNRTLMKVVLGSGGPRPRGAIEDVHPPG
jgi:H+-translocating NAD(P) transhydrogenase subunit beta